MLFVHVWFSFLMNRHRQNNCLHRSMSFHLPPFRGNVHDIKFDPVWGQILHQLIVVDRRSRTKSMPNEIQIVSLAESNRSMWFFADILHTVWTYNVRQMIEESKQLIKFFTIPLANFSEVPVMAWNSLEIVFFAIDLIVTDKACGLIVECCQTDATT